MCNSARPAPWPQKCAVYTELTRGWQRLFDTYSSCLWGATPLALSLIHYIEEQQLAFGRVVTCDPDNDSKLESQLSELITLSKKPLSGRLRSVTKQYTAFLTLAAELQLTADLPGFTHLQTLLDHVRSVNAAQADPEASNVTKNFFKQQLTQWMDSPTATPDNEAAAAHRAPAAQDAAYMEQSETGSSTVLTSAWLPSGHADAWSATEGTNSGTAQPVGSTALQQQAEFELQQEPATTAEGARAHKAFPRGTACPSALTLTNCVVVQHDE